MSHPSLTEKTYSILLNGPYAHLSSVILAAFKYEPLSENNLNMFVVLQNDQMKRVYEVAIDAIQQGYLRCIKVHMPVHINHTKIAGNFFDHKVSFLTFLNWAKPIFGDEIPYELKKQEPPPEEVKPDDQKQDILTTKEKNSFLKVIFALLKSRYKHDPDAQRSDTTHKVQKLIDEVGLKMDRKTVKKIIDEAYIYADQNPEKE